MTDIADRLRPGEKLLWRGQPGQGIRLTARDALLIPFSLLWGSFALFWEFNAGRRGGPWFFLLFGGAFAAVGLYLIIGRFFFDAWLRFNTQYAVTSERVLIQRAGLFSTFTALNRQQIPELRIDESADGRGTIVLGPSLRRTRWAGWTPALDPTPQFIAIADARRVFEEIQRPARALAP